MIEDRAIVRRFIKETDMHCFPIFPRFNPTSKWRHAFNLPGWDYYMDCSNVVINELEVPVREAELPESSEEPTTFPLPLSQVQPFQMIISNNRPVFQH